MPSKQQLYSNSNIPFTDERGICWKEPCNAGIATALARSSYNRPRFEKVVRLRTHVYKVSLFLRIGHALKVVPCSSETANKILRVEFLSSFSPHEPIILVVTAIYVRWQ
jgi:hypothetical protein